jgi:uncharacterized membrane protein
LAFASGNTYIYFLQPVISNVILALLFLLSLATTRPVVARLAADFYPMSADVAAVAVTVFATLWVARRENLLKPA